MGRKSNANAVRRLLAFVHLRPIKEDMYNALLHSHSGLRWIVLACVLGAIVKSIIGLTGGSPFDKASDKLTLFSLISCHLMLVIGLVLYGVSPIVHAGFQSGGSIMKDPILRFWIVEHLSMMIIGIALITIGRVRLKKLNDDKAKHKNVLIFFGIGLLLILSRIPWPFMEIGANRGWF